MDELEQMGLGSPSPQPQSPSRLLLVLIILLGIGLGIILTLAGLALVNRVQPAPMVILPPPTAVPTPTASPLRVYINGQVQNAAVYSLPPGAIVQDLLEQAGGFTVDAQQNMVNLALPLQDGMQIYVPHVDEAQTFVSNDLVRPATASPEGNTAVDNTNATTNTNNNNGNGLININTASQTELETLPGIGPSTAEKIIAHRDENGLFATIEGLMDVSGIGPAKFAQVEALVTVGSD